MFFNILMGSVFILISGKYPYFIHPFRLLLYITRLHARAGSRQFHGLQTRFFSIQKNHCFIEFYKAYDGFALFILLYIKETFVWIHYMLMRFQLEDVKVI